METGKDGRVANVGQPGLCARSGVMLQTEYGRDRGTDRGLARQGGGASGRGTARGYIRQDTAGTGAQ